MWKVFQIVILSNDPILVFYSPSTLVLTSGG